MLVTEGHRLERENRFARLVHRLNLVLETLRGNYGAEVTVGIDNYLYTSGHRRPANAGNKGACLSSYCADPDGVGLGRHAGVANINIVTAGRKLGTGKNA